ncbi:MAG: MerR family transcriptional regulator [Planctomycetes bacterium]|nr:MerR family transcriptional regulator [Planctomycetota bacterium]
MEGDTQKLYSVGSVAKDTGIRQDTIRIWERRYGRPTPVRLESGHRRFTYEQLLWLRQVAAGLSLGHRPSKLLKLSDEELQALLEDHSPAQKIEGLQPLLKAIEGFDSDLLRNLLESAQRQMGLLQWLTEVIAPLLHKIGLNWAEGHFSIHHEHFASNLIMGHLQAELRQMPIPQSPETVLLATLPNEQHALGLFMAASVLASHGFPLKILGSDLPLDELLGAQQKTAAKTVAISVSSSGGGPSTDRELEFLRAQIPENCTLLVGGAGAKGNRRGIRGIQYLGDLVELDQWCQTGNR